MVIKTHSQLLIVDLFISKFNIKGSWAMEENIELKKEKAKKQILLRLSPSLWNELASWSEEDFRSINGQIEFLLADCVRKRKKEK